MLDRRRFLQFSGAALTALATSPVLARPAEASAQPLAARLARIERDSGGRLGVAVLDSADGRLYGQRLQERFPMCSTFKFLLAAAVLRQVEQGRLALDRRVPIAAADLLGNSPATARHVGVAGMSVAELCEATIIWSDNAAANLLYPLVGGPAGLTAFLRGSGDSITRCDRLEPHNNDFTAGDPRDTTTPAAMAASARRLLLGEVMQPASRQRLQAWLLDNRTGGARLRAGLPRGWRLGDKTGSNGRDTVNDVALIWPGRGRAPLLVAAFLNGAKGDDDARNAALAAVGRALAAHAQG